MTINCSGIWLKKGSKGTLVKTLQEDLNNKGISKSAINGSLATDGSFGSVTETVVKYAQEKVLKTTKDGIVGPETCEALNAYKASSTNTTGLVTINYTEDRQDTSYTCGPSSWKMAASHYGLNVDEIWLGKQIGADPKSGTSVQNMVYGATVINKQYGSKLSAKSEVFSSWETLKGYLSKGYPVILRIQSFINPNGGEHYVLLYGIDITGGNAYLGDPSYGKRVISLTGLRERIRKVSSNSIIVVSK